VEYPRNKGKGGAVRTVFSMLLYYQGVLLSRGEYVLFLDADGATKISDFQKVFDQVKGAFSYLALKNHKK
jgi:hypothetical protein